MNIDCKVLIISDNYDIKRIINIDNYKAVICLFWLAPSTKASLEEAKDTIIFSLQELISDEMEWGRRAYDLASQTFTRGPRYNDLPIRRYLSEPLYEESFLPYLVKRVIEICEKLRTSWDIDRLTLEGCLTKAYLDLFSQYLSGNKSLIFKATGLDQEVTADNRFYLINRLLQRLKEAWATKDWCTQFMDLMEWLDKKFHYRRLLGAILKKPGVAKGGITFFSSYQNNSRILATFAEMMPLKVNWLLANYSAFRGLRQKQSKYSWIWQFFKKMKPQLQIKGDLLSPEERALPDMTYIANTITWNNWEKTECQLLINLTEAWEAYLDEAEPCLIVMANQMGIEGWFIELAKRRGIPVLLVMHGMLIGYLYTRTPILADAMIVPGEFWKNLWPEEEKNKILVFNPPKYFPRVSRVADRCPQTLTFFSWPLTMIPYYNYYEFTDAFLKNFHNLLVDTDIEIIIRGHPLEDLYNIVGHWQELYGSIPDRLVFSKDESLETIIQRTDIALMFRSTVMLNCLANNIPVIIPGWIDYGWNDDLHLLSDVYAAKDFQDIEERVKYWVENPIIGPEDNDNYFLKTPGKGMDEFSSYLNGLTGF